MGTLIAMAVTTALAQAGGASPGFVRELIAAAVAQTSERVVYDGSYRRIPYPGGDVPSHIGVCTDVVIRAYRAVGVDKRSSDGTRPLVAHNIGNGPEVEDMLFRFPVTGHYRYRGE